MGSEMCIRDRTDLDGTVTLHDGNFLAVDGFPFFDVNVFGGRR